MLQRYTILRPFQIEWDVSKLNFLIDIIFIINSLTENGTISDKFSAANNNYKIYEIKISDESINLSQIIDSSETSTRDILIEGFWLLFCRSFYIKTFSAYTFLEKVKGDGNKIKNFGSCM